MIYVMSSIRSFVMVALCLNPVLMVASEFRSFPVYSIPGAHSGFNGGWGSGVRLGSQNIFSFVDYKAASKIIAATMVCLVVFYVYKTKYCSKELTEAGGVVEREIDTYIVRMKGKVDSYIDKLLLPEVMKSYIKESISQSIAEHIANTRGSVKRYYDNNKKYFISILAIPGGIFLGWPVTGGIVGTTGLLLGAIQSIRQEMAVFRKENEEFHKGTQKQMADGFKNVDEKAEENKQVVLDKIDQEVKSLSGQIQIISNHINQLNDDLSGKVDGVGDKVEKLSGELQKATEQMVLLHGNRDIKDAELFKKLEETSNELTIAQKSLGNLVTTLMEEASRETKKEFEIINETLAQIDDKQDNQAAILTNVQNKIGTLLDNREADEKKFTELLDAIQSSNISLEELKIKTGSHESTFGNFQIAFDEMKKDRESLSQSVNKSILQCTNMSDRISKLEIKVDTNQAVVIELLKKNNEALLLKMELFEKKAAEKENILLQTINVMREEQKKAEEENKEKLNELVDFTKQYNNSKSPQLTYELSKKTKQNRKKDSGNDQYKSVSYGSNNQFQQEPSQDDLRSQMLQLQYNKY